MDSLAVQHKCDHTASAAIACLAIYSALLNALASFTGRKNNTIRPSHVVHACPAEHTHARIFKHAGPRRGASIGQAGVATNNGQFFIRHLQRDSEWRLRFKPTSTVDEEKHCKISPTLVLAPLKLAEVGVSPRLCPLEDLCLLLVSRPLAIVSLGVEVGILWTFPVVPQVA